MSINVTEKITLLLNHNLEVQDYKFDSEYQNIFEFEGKRKVKYILDYLKENAELNNEDLSNYLYVSIGGADGSEIEAVLEDTEIRYGYLLEISDEAAGNARKKAEIIKSKNKTLTVFQGDATQRLNDLILGMKELKKTKNIRGVILSAQAVLHELPKRSPGYNPSVFLGKLFSVFENNILFAREPIKVVGWPETIQISVGDDNAENLKKLADVINDRLQITNYETNSIANGFINIDSVLGLELLHKLLRSESISKFTYELGEQLTSIEAEDLKKIIENHLDAGTVNIEYTTTEGFKQAWKEHNVKVKSDRGVSLGLPNTHARIIAVSLKKSFSDDIKKTVPNQMNTKINTISNRKGIQEQYGDSISRVKSRFCVYGIGLSGFVEAYKDLIREKSRKGVKIKMLTLSPREEIFKIFFKQKTFSLLSWRDFESENGEKHQNDSKQLQDWVFEENLKLIEEGIDNLIELKFYSSLPVGAIMIADDILFYSPYLVNKNEENSTMVFQKNDAPYEKFNKYFQDLWNSNVLSVSTINNHVLYYYQANGCIIDLLRKRRQYVHDYSKINTSSLVDHAKEKLLYNELAPIFSDAASRNTVAEVNFIRDIEKIRRRAIEYIVDLGCGVGRHSVVLAKDYNVTAIDISYKEIEIAKKSKGPNFQVGDMRDWNVDFKADLIICMWSTFNYLSTPNDVDDFIESCKRNLDKKGMILIDLKNPVRKFPINYLRQSYCYPYDIEIDISKTVINDNILNGTYNYKISNVKTGESVYVTDQELNRQYTLKEIEKAFSRDFTVTKVFGNYSINSEYGPDSDRLLILLTIND